LFIAADSSNNPLSTHDIKDYFRFVLERIDLRRDLHFQTQTTIDTLDYSGTGLNSGSKLIVAAYGEVIRTLDSRPPQCLKELRQFHNAQIALPGIVTLQTDAFSDYNNAAKEMEALNEQLFQRLDELKNIPLIIICDDSSFTAASLNNFLWVTFTRSNPSHDVYGIKSFTRFKHWGCEGPMVIDARIKPHHAPPLEKDPAVERRIDKLFSKGGSLYNVLK